MAIPVAHRVRATALQVTIGITLTTIPGLQNLKINWGEKKSFENSDLDSDYEAPEPSGLLGEQSATFDLILDPLGTVHQFLNASFNHVAVDEVAANDEQKLTGNIIFGMTGQEVPCSFFISKFDDDLSKGAGMMASCEIKFLTRISKPEADPV